MGMSFETYCSLTPTQFQEAYRVFLEKTAKDRDQAELIAWQVARWQVWRTLCPPDLKQMSVLDLLQLPGDPSASSGTGKHAKPKKDPEKFRKLAEKWKD